MEKNKYKNSKHFLLIYYPLSKPCLHCRKLCKDLNPAFYSPIKTFDTLLDVNKFISSRVFIKTCFDAKVYCVNQLKVLIGIDSKYLNNTVNRYLIKDFETKPFINNGYFFYIENTIHLEEFIDSKSLNNIDKGIKNYAIIHYWQKLYEDVKYL